MKKMVMIVTHVLVALFIAFLSVQDTGYMLFKTYPSVLGIGMKKDVQVTPQLLEEELTKLANDTHSMIAQRIIDAETTTYTYHVYGNRSLPIGLQKATQQQVANSSLMGGYIFEGDVSGFTLSQTLERLGYEKAFVTEGSFLVTATTLLFNTSFGMVLVMSILSLMALTLIYRVKDLRNASITLISGVSLRRIIWRQFVTESVHLGVAFIVAFVVGQVYLSVFHMWHWRLAVVLTLAIALFSLASFMVVLGCSIVYVLSLKKQGLMQLIKGKMPLYRLLALLCIGQFIAIIAVGLSNRSVFHYANFLNTHSHAKQMWQHTQDYTVIGFNPSATPQTKQTLQDEPWYQFLVDEVSYHDALLARHFAGEVALGKQIGSPVTLHTYHPKGNTLYVTPNYLKKQGVTQEDVRLSDETYALLLPESLKGQEEVYEKQYSTYLSQQFALPPQTIKAVIGYLPMGQKRFIYNAESFAPEQFLNDPIIVVVTPQSLPAASFWWSVMTRGMHFKDTAQWRERLETANMQSWLATVQRSQELYAKQSKRIVAETQVALFGSILGMFSAMLLFHAMHVLYFEQFRRDIFIKRLSGISFVTLHGAYLATQFVLLLSAFTVLVVVTKDVVMSSVTISLVIGMTGLLLWRQHKREEKMAITILKGK